MTALPPHPHLGQLRHQAKDLLHAARGGDAVGVARLRGGPRTRPWPPPSSPWPGEYGFGSWGALKAAVQARNAEFAAANARHNPRPDWPATVRVLLDAGASAGDIGLSPDDPKPPSADVADLLRAHGAGG